MIIDLPPLPPTAIHRRLNHQEIGLLRHLFRVGAGSFAVSLDRPRRRAAVPMWRRGIVNAWYRQAPSLSPSWQGPYFNLSEAGVRLAAKFMRPRASAVQSGRGRP